MSRSIRRRTLLVAATAAVLAAAIGPLADARACSLARVDVYDRDAGRALPVYRHAGRHYVEGRPGNEYAVRIRNCTGERLLAVLSVDGVNAVSGETASPDQSGYVIEPWGYVTVQGWRKDLERTAAFYFSDPHDSYAARTGRPDDLGVIGVALFRERPPAREHWWSRERRAESPSASASASAARGAAEPGAVGEAVEGRTADAAVDLWLRVIDARARYEVQARFSTWLYTLARHRLIDHWRSRHGISLASLEDDGVVARAEESAASMRDADDDPLHATIDDESRRRLLAALAGVPPLQRDAFLLHVEGGLTLEQIASLTATPGETVKSRLRYAYRRLREALEDVR